MKDEQVGARRWYQRLYDRLLTSGLSAREADALVQGTSKHGRAKTKPRDFEQRRKRRWQRERMARRRNRGR